MLCPTSRPPSKSRIETMANRTKRYGSGKKQFFGGNSNLFFGTPAVQFSSVRIPTVKFKSVTNKNKKKTPISVWSSRNHQASTKSAWGLRKEQNQQECQGFSAVPLSMKWRSGNTRIQKRFSQFTVPWVLLRLTPNIMCPPKGVASASSNHMSLKELPRDRITWQNQKFSLHVLFTCSLYSTWSIEKNLIQPGCSGKR